MPGAGKAGTDMADGWWADLRELREQLTPSAVKPFRNPFGEVVYLRRIKGGLTDCCPVSDPCVVHAALVARNKN